MKTLLILRHAKSSWDNASLSDHERPLNKRGKRDAPRMGRLLQREELVPDQIISSSAVRARTTAVTVAENCGYADDVTITRQLYHAGPASYVAVLNNVDDSAKVVMVVGHNPGMEELVEDLIGAWERMPTAALAQVELPIDSWQEMDISTVGKLINLWRPKELKD